MIYKSSEYARNSHGIRFDITKRSATIEIAMLSDFHWDNPDCDRELVIKHLDYCKANNIPVVINGDLFCLMQGKADRRGSKEKVRPEHRNGNYFDAIVTTAVEFFTPYADTIILIGYGNHETAIQKHQETDILRRFVDMLNFVAKPTQPVFVGGYGGALSVEIKAGGGNHVYSIHYFHGSGGGGIVTRGEINLTRLMASTDNYDCITIGHVHENKETVVVKNSYNAKSKKVKQREILMMITGTYKDEYKDGADGWHVERGAPPKPIGGRLLTIEYRRPEGQAVEFRAYSKRLI
jgi:hypothetical protein